MNPSSLRLPKPMKKGECRASHNDQTFEFELSNVLYDTPDQMLPIQKDTSRWKGSYDILFFTT